MATTSNTTIVAAFRNSADAQAAAADLQAAGISRADIYLESSNATSTSTSSRTEATDSYASRSAHTEGGVVGWFKSLFGDDDTASHTGYQNTLSQGGYLLSVDAPESHLDTIEDILNRHNPVNVSSDEKSSYGTAAPVAGAYAATAATPVVGATQANTAVGAESIPVIQEDLQVGKRSVLRGGIRVFSRVVETPVQENVELREETVRVNRQAVNRPATEADFATGRNQAIEVEQYGEEAVVGKKARVVEEVQVGKEVSERTETVKDSLRHTEIEVEQLSADKFQTKTTGK